jgi:pimeloyl-ACP methyl ester carboxylesterase
MPRPCQSAAWRTAWLAPQRVAGLILVDSSGPPFTPRSMPIGFRVARVPVLTRVMEWVLPRSVVAESVASVYGNPLLLRTGFNNHELVGNCPISSKYASSHVVGVIDENLDAGIAGRKDMYHRTWLSAHQIRPLFLGQ